MSAPIMASRKGLVTLGETMALLSTDEIGPLRHVRHLRVGVAGAESNVAIGARRLGAPATWIGRVGSDDIGDLVEATLRGEDLALICHRDTTRPTGLMLKGRRTTTTSRVTYYRAGSAASALSPADVPESAIATASILHISGITPALSSSCRESVEFAVDVARHHGVLVSFDVNYRAALWSPAQARPILQELAVKADILFAGQDEAALLLDQDNLPADRLAAALQGHGPAEVIIKRGAAGALALIEEDLIGEPGIAVTAIDHVGAGDAFVAGYLAAHVHGADPKQRLHQANLTGAFAVTVAGDWEGAPTASELALLEHPDGTVLR